LLLGIIGTPGRDISDRVENLQALVRPGRRFVLDGELGADAVAPCSTTRTSATVRTANVAACWRSSNA
jgi:hypothetical protein